MTPLTPKERAALVRAHEHVEPRHLMYADTDADRFTCLAHAAVARGEVVRVTPSEVPANASERIERDWPAWKKQMREQARNAEQYVRENDEDERAHCRAALAPDAVPKLVAENEELARLRAIVERVEAICDRAVAEEEDQYVVEILELLRGER